MAPDMGASHRSDTTDYILEMFSHDNGQTWTGPKKIIESWEEDGNIHTRATASTFVDAERGITIQVGTEARQDKMVVTTVKIPNGAGDCRTLDTARSQL